MKDSLINKCLDFLDYNGIVEKIVVPAFSKGKFIQNIVQIVLVLFFWKSYKEWIIQCNLNDKWVYWISMFLMIGVALVFSRLFYLVYLCLERLNNKVFSVLEKIEEFLKAISIFWEYDTSYEKRFLKERYVVIRKSLKAYLTLLTSDEVCQIIFSRVIGKNWDDIDRLAYIFIITAVYKIFCAYTKQEYEEMWNKIPTYKESLKEYEKNLKKYGYLPVTKVIKNPLRTVRKRVLDERPMDKEERFLYSCTNSLDHLELMRALLKEKSVLTDTPFYKDMGVALFMPLHEALLKEKKIIILSGGSESREEIEAWIKAGLLSVTEMEEFWRIKSLTKGERDWDIGIVMPDDMCKLYETNALLQNAYGVIAIILHPERLLIEAQSELFQWGYILSKQPVKPVYVVIERAMLGLLDVVSHIFSSEFIYISTAAERAEVMKLYAVNGDFISDKVAKRTPKIHLSEGFVRCAEKAGFNEVRWEAGEKIAFYDINSIKKQYKTQIDPSLNSMTSDAECKEGIWGLEKEKLAFLIYEDEFYNIAELFRQASTRGIDRAVVSIASSRYLLYSYMLYHIERFSLDLYAIPAITADFSEDCSNRTISLISIFLNNHLSSSEIRELFGIYISNEADLKYARLSDDEISILKKKIVRTLGKNSEDTVVIELGQDDKYILQLNKNLQREYKNLMKPAIYYDEEENIKTLMHGRYFWQIDQLYLPEQIVVLDGKLYQIKGRENIYTDEVEKTEVLTVRRYRSGLVYYHNYFQERVYFLNGLLQDEFLKEVFGVRWKLTGVPFSVNTAGYYNMDIEKERIEYTALRETKNREYKADRERNGLIMQFKEKVNWEERRTLVIIFSEVLKTLFPKGYPYIAVLTPDRKKIREKGREACYRHLYYTLIEGEGEEMEYDLLILEDSRLELGILSAIDKHMEHILRIIYSYCQWWNKADKKNKSAAIVKSEKWERAMADIKVFINLLEENGIEELPHGK